MKRLIAKALYEDPAIEKHVTKQYPLAASASWTT